MFSPNPPISNLQYHRHNQRPPLRLARDVALEICADFFFDHAVVGFLFGARGVEGFEDDLAGALDHSVFAGGEASGHDFGGSFDQAAELVDGDDGHDEAVFAQMAAVFDDQILHYICARAGVDADAAHLDASGLAGAVFVDFENVSAFNQHDAAHRAVHRPSQFGMELELAIFAVDRDEILGPHQVDDELQFFAAGVPANVDRRVGAVVVDDVGFAAEQVVDHSIDGFFVAGNNARRQNDGVALFDFGMLVVIDGSARQRRHRFSLSAADED